MAFPNNIKIHEECKISPQSPTQISFPLTYFDLIWLKVHPVERIYFYTLPNSQSHPTFFFQNIVPKLKSSLSLTLQNFLPLAGKIIWPSDSSKPFIQFNPNSNDDGVSFLVTESDLDFNHVIQNSPKEASLSHSLIPHLESTDSFANVISIQITLFPKNGFSIGITTHHAVLDGKSSTMFIKAWSSISKSFEETQSPNLEPFLEPFLSKVVINDPNDFESLFINRWMRMSSHSDNNNQRSLKIMLPQPISKDLVRATFELKREDLDKLNKRVLSQWNIIEQKDSKIESLLKPTKISTFVLTCSYVFICIAKANQQANLDNNLKFACGFTVDCRTRLDPPIHENYFGNCVTTHMVETEYEDFTKEDAVVIIAMKIYEKIKKLDEGVLDGMENLMFKIMAMISQGVKTLGVTGSTRFGVYENDFGWGRPEKVEIVSIDKDLTIGLAESKDLKGGVEFGLVLDKHVMDFFNTIFHEGK